MMLPIRALFDLVEPRLEPALVTSESRERIQDLASRLPGSWCWGLVETRLHRSADQVDFMVCARQGRGAAAAAEGTLLPPSVREALARWLQPGTILNREVPAIWLEYDMVPETKPDPLISFCVDPLFWDGRFHERLSPDRLISLLREALTAATGQAPDTDALTTLRRLAEHLPDEGRILHVASLRPRGREVLRILVCLPRVHIVSWLRRVGWPGSSRQIDDSVGLIDQERSQIGVQLDVSQGIGPYFAAEDDFHPTPAGHEGARRLLARLVASGLCDADKGEAVLRWMGCATHQPAGSAWRIMVQHQVYFKLVAGERGTLEAKAYLGFQGRFTLF